MFDLQRFDFSLTATTQQTDSVFSVKKGDQIYFGTSADFKTDNLSGVTDIQILGDITLADNVEVDLGKTITNVIKVAANATLALGEYTLTIKRDSGDGSITLNDTTSSPDSTYNKPISAIVVQNGKSFTVTGGTNGKIEYTWDPTTASLGSKDNLAKSKAARTSAAVQVGEKVGTYTASEVPKNTAQATFNMKSGIITSKSTAISMSDNAIVNISGGKTESEKSCGIYYGNKSPGGGKITVSGGLLQSGTNSKLPAIQVSGSVGESPEQAGAEVEISGGTVAFTNNGYNDSTETSNEYFDIKGKPVGNPDAIYAGGKTKLTIKDNANITSTGTAVELRAGSLDFTGGSVTSTATKAYSVNTSSATSSGGQTFGAALAIAQHATKQNIEVQIGGTAQATGQVALAVENPSNPNYKNSTITATITGGTFESMGEGATAIAAKAADSRSTININGTVTFIGTVENTVTDANTTTPSITFGENADVTVVTVLERDENGNITKQEEETYDSTSIQFTETWTENGEEKTETYPVNDEAWNKSKENPANKFYYLVANTTTQNGQTVKSKIAGAKAVLAPKATGTDETTLALTTGLTNQESYDDVIALDLNDTIFSSLFGEDRKFKTLDASAITQVSTTTGTGADAVTTNSDRLKLNITGNKNITSILGSKGNDTLTAGANGASLNGDDGDDLLIGSSDTSKSDTFIYTAGADSIQGYSTVDVVSLSGVTAPTSFSNVNYTGSDYIVSLGGNAGDSLTFKATNAFSLTDGTNTYHYTTTSIAKGDTEITLGPDHSNRFDASSTNYTKIDGSAVTNAIRITGNDKGDYIIGGSSGGTIIGGALGDTLVASGGSTTLNGGDGADSLVGGSGADVFVYTGGADSINGYTLSQGDLVSVRGFNPTDATFSVGDNISLDFGGTDKLIFEGVEDNAVVSLRSGRTNYRYTKDYFATDDGITLAAGYNTDFVNNDNYTTIDGSAVTKDGGISITGNDNKNYIIGSTVQGSSLYGGADDDTLVGNATEADVFRYTAGNDVIQNFGENDKLDIDTTAITKARASSSRLTFTTTEKGTLTFRSDDSAPTKVALAGENAGYLTADGVVSGNSLNLFASAKGKIDLKDDSLYSDITTVVADSVKSQSVTLVGGTQGGSFSFYKDNKKRDGFEYGGGDVTITNYEAGKDRINLGTASISGFSVGDNNLVAISVGGIANAGVISLQGAAGSEVLIHDANSKGNNSYKKMVFDESGVMYDKVKSKATSATLWSGAGGAASLYSATAANKLKKITVKDSSVAGISIQAGNNNTVIDASKAGGVSLVSGNKNDKFIGSATNADTFIYTAGKDIIQAFDADDKISLNGASEDITLNKAKITAGKKSVKFKFGNKDVLTIKSDSLTGAEITIDGVAQSFGKNAIVKDNDVTLTSQFGGTYKVAGDVNYVDGELVSKKLTFKGTASAESLIGGSSKTLFKGDGGADSLVGGAGADTFFYAKGNEGTATIANFDFDHDKLKIAGGTIAKNSITSLESGGVQFAMKKDKGEDAAAVGWFNVASSVAAGGATGVGDIDASKVAIKANNTYYWFAKEDITEEVTTSGGDGSTVTIAAGSLITWGDKKVSKSDLSADYNVIELKYATNLVKSGVASVVSSTNDKAKLT